MMLNRRISLSLLVFGFGCNTTGVVNQNVNEVLAGDSTPTGDETPDEQSDTDHERQPPGDSFDPGDGLSGDAAAGDVSSGDASLPGDASPPGDTPSQGDAPPVVIPPDVIVVDHTNVDLFDSIPTQYISAAKAMRFFYCNRSVGGNIFDGLKCLGGDPNHPANQAGGPGYDPTDPHFIPSSCRRPSYEAAEYMPSPDYRTAEAIDPGDVQTWFYEYWGDDPLGGDAGTWSGRVSYFINTTSHRIGEFDVISYQQSYLAVNDGSTIAHPTEGFFTNQPAASDIFDVEAYQAQHPNKIIFLMTSSLARGIGTIVSRDYNQQMRDYVISGTRPGRIRILLDVADILSHDLQDNPCYDNRDGVSLDDNNNVIPDDGLDIPAICTDYTSEWNGGHLGNMSAGKIRVAKAIWVLMARLAGWDGQP